MRFWSSRLTTMSANCCGRDQPALGLDLELIGRRRLAERRRADVARRDLDIVAAQGGDDVVHRQIARCGLVRIDPDADGVVPRRPHRDVADAGDTQQRLFDLQGDVVGDVLLIERSVRRVHVHRHQDVRRALAHGDARRLDLGRQTRQGRGDAVLHQLLRLIEIGAELEGDGDLQVAVTGGVRRHVDHVLDPVDLLLDRVGHGLGDGLRRGARIGQGDVDRGRDDLRILRRAEVREGDRAKQGDQHGDHDREHRSVDHEVGELHPKALSGSGRRRSPRPEAARGRRDWATRRGSAGRSSPILSFTTAPTLAFCTPSITTRSSGFSPPRTARRPLTSGPVVTLRCSTLWPGPTT